MDHHKTIETMRETVAYMRETISALEAVQETADVPLDTDYPSDRLLLRLRQAVIASETDHDVSKLQKRVLMALAHFHAETEIEQ